MCVRVVRHALADLDAVLRIKAVAAAGVISSLQVRIAYLNSHVLLLAIVKLSLCAEHSSGSRCRCQSSVQVNISRMNVRVVRLRCLAHTSYP